MYQYMYMHLIQYLNVSIIPNTIHVHVPIHYAHTKYMIHVQTGHALYMYMPMVTCMKKKQYRKVIIS